MKAMKGIFSDTGQGFTAIPSGLDLGRSTVSVRKNSKCAPLVSTFSGARMPVCIKIQIAF